MNKIVFVNAYEFDYLGTRALASWLQLNGFYTHNILMDDNIEYIVDTPQEEFIGYQLYNGFLSEHRAMHHPLVREDWDALEQAIRAEKPQILGFSARSTNNFLLTSIVESFKKAAPDALFIAGGFGPTLEPDLYLKAGFDVVVRGDGEEAILEIARCVERNDVTSMRCIANTNWNAIHGGRINSLRDQEKDLSRYPAPLSGHEHFSWIQDGVLHRHDDPMLRSGIYRTFLGRGCPGKCTYCSGGHWKSLYRREEKKGYARRNRAIGDVIEECHNLPDSIQTISFCDEYWSLPRKKSQEFFSLYKTYVNKPFGAYLNYEQMVQHPELLELIIDAGLDWTGIGFQTGAADFLQKYYGRQARYPLLLAYAQLLFENFVNFSAQFIGGNCYESWDDLEQTFDLIRALPVSLEYPDAVIVSNIRLRPHPKSPIIKAWPRVVTDPMPAEEWYFRAILMQYCRFFTPEEFSALITPFVARLTQKDAKKTDISALERHLRHMFRAKQIAHYRSLVQNTAGEPWVYYGAGDCYAKNREFFAALKPQVILVDKAYMPSATHIDGIPVAAVEEFFTEENAKYNNFMVFLNQPQAVKRKCCAAMGLRLIKFTPVAKSFERRHYQPITQSNPHGGTTGRKSTWIAVLRFF